MAEHQHGTAAEHSEESMRSYTLVFAALMVLLALTVAAYYINLGPLNLPVVALVIAFIKATMVLMVFMHVRLSPKLVWVFATAAFLWLAIMIGGFENDYSTRKYDAEDSAQNMTPVPLTIANDSHH